MNQKIADRLRQPTTVQGIALVVAALAGYGAFIVSHGAPGAVVGAASAAAGLVMSFLDDNSADKGSVEKLVDRTAQAALSNHLSSVTPDIVAQVLAALQAQAQPAPTGAVALNAQKS